MEGQPRHTDKEIEWKQGDELSDSGSPMSLAGILRRSATEARRQGLLCPPHPSPGAQCHGEKREKGGEGKQTCSDNRRASLPRKGVCFGVQRQFQKRQRDGF